MGSLGKTSIALFLLFIIALIFIGYFLPKGDKIVVSKTVNCTDNQAYNLVNDLKNWEKWSPWMEKDPKMKLSYSDSSTGAGAYYTWVGNSEVGFGKLSILSSTENKKIDMNLNFSEHGETPCSFEFIPETNGTKINWSMDAQYSQNWFLKNILGGYSYMMMKYFLHNDFNRGLDNIDKQCKS
jgi:ribosome-associated toxin RatA of RatAB toxin-antitoxin module